MDSDDDLDVFSQGRKPSTSSYGNPRPSRHHQATNPFATPSYGQRGAPASPSASASLNQYSYGAEEVNAGKRERGTYDAYDPYL